MRREKKISCRGFETEKNILPTRLLEKEKSCRPEITHPPRQELNGRPLRVFNANRCFVNAIGSFQCCSAFRVFKVIAYAPGK